MVHFEKRHVHVQKGESAVVLDLHNSEEEQEGVHHGHSNRKIIIRPKVLSLVFLSLLACTLVLATSFSFFPSALSLSYSLAEVDKVVVNASLCSSVPAGTICCDRSSIRSDVCIMKGDVRTQSKSSSVLLYASKDTTEDISHGSDHQVNRKEELQHEKIKPYTRKWEASVMNTIDQLDLISKKQDSGIHHHCDVKHDVPAVFFSTGGYTGNVYHEFNDGLLPLFITSQHLNKKVVFVILEYHDWWISKYASILDHLSEYPPIDFTGDNRTHCFPEAIVGLKIHDELTVDSSLMDANVSVRNFRDILDRAYRPRITDIIEEEKQEAQLLKENSASPLSTDPQEVRNEKDDNGLKKPKLVIVSRNGSRAITNEDSLVKMAEEIGFFVEVLRPKPDTELAKIYRSLNSSDVMIGVHGAAMTHFLFMKPGSVFIQVVPLGTNWAAETYYGEPAKKLGLRYIGYEILPKESSLYDEYDSSDPVLRDPESINIKGWEFTKKIYLDRQKVKLNLERFRKRLVRSYNYSIIKRNLAVHHRS
ncbi:xylan glycosyltransferase MUCI21 [Daucus carota subsp. sativus]|uniref:xylan glycosyltransferase MUCI21 n=1 Tax=Daucus carota subsp. sativus TaxID=79200 RepID=UPI0030834DCB